MASQEDAEDAKLSGFQVSFEGTVTFIGRMCLLSNSVRFSPFVGEETPAAPQKKLHNKLPSNDPCITFYHIQQLPLVTEYASIDQSMHRNQFYDRRSRP